MEAVGLDAGGFTAAICKGLEDREIEGVIAYDRPSHKKGYLYKKDFIYSESTDTYLCPHGQPLVYSTTNREGYREYKSTGSVAVVGKAHCQGGAGPLRSRVRWVKPIVASTLRSSCFQRVNALPRCKER